MQHMRMRTGQHPFGGSNRVLPEWQTQIVCQAAPPGRKKIIMYYCRAYFFDRLTCPLLLHPKCISGRWILVPFGDEVSQTNVLSFARIIVVSVRMLGDQLPRPPTPDPRPPIPYTYVHMPHVVPKLNRSCNPPSILRN